MLLPTAENSAFRDAIPCGNHSPHFQESTGKDPPCTVDLLTVLRRDRDISEGASCISRLLLCLCAAEKVKHTAAIKISKQSLPLETGIY